MSTEQEVAAPSAADRLRDKIRQASDIDSEIVDVPEWGVKVEVRSMTGLQRSRYLKRVGGDAGEVDFEVLYPLLLVSTCHDPESGERLFTEDDVDWLNEKSSRPVERLATVANRLSGLDQNAESKLGEASSSATHASTVTGGSHSTSLSNSDSPTPT